MATMTYTNPGWTNGGAPAITGGVGGTLTLLSDALASIGAAGANSVRKADSASDANTVSAYGIGVTGTTGSGSALADGTDLDTILVGSIVNVKNPASSGSTLPGAGTYYTVFCGMRTANTGNNWNGQIAVSHSGFMYFRSMNAGTWSAWSYIPTMVATAYVDSVGNGTDFYANGTHVPGGPSELWYGFWTGYVESTRLFSSVIWGFSAVAGNSALGAPANTVHVAGFSWRVK